MPAAAECRASCSISGTSVQRRKSSVKEPRSPGTAGDLRQRPRVCQYPLHRGPRELDLHRRQHAADQHDTIPSVGLDQIGRYGRRRARSRHAGIVGLGGSAGRAVGWAGARVAVHLPAGVGIAGVGRRVSPRAGSALGVHPRDRRAAPDLGRTHDRLTAPSAARPSVARTSPARTITAWPITGWPITAGPPAYPANPAVQAGTACTGTLPSGCVACCHSGAPGHLPGTRPPAVDAPADRLRCAIGSCRIGSLPNRFLLVPPADPEPPSSRHPAGCLCIPSPIG